MCTGTRLARRSAPQPHKSDVAKPGWRAWSEAEGREARARPAQARVVRQSVSTSSRSIAARPPPPSPRRLDRHTEPRDRPNTCTSPVVRRWPHRSQESRGRVHDGRDAPVAARSDRASDTPPRHRACVRRSSTREGAPARRPRPGRAAQPLQARADGRGVVASIRPSPDPGRGADLLSRDAGC